jgi:TonB family protein
MLAGRVLSADAARATYEIEFLSGEKSVPPRILTRVAPVYPEGSKGKSAMVILETTIGTDGRVKNAKVLSGDPAFHAAAKDSVVQWVFDPARHLGQPIEVSYMITILFKPE